MHVLTAYHRRETLPAIALERLYKALKNQVDEYRFAIRNYPADRMEKYGVPYLSKLEAKVAEVERLLRLRAED